MPSYLVTYIVHDSDRHLQPQFMVSHTEDFATNLRAIVGRRGVMKKLVRFYNENNYVQIPELGNRRVISHIHINPLPEADKQVLKKYFWPIKILARLLGV